MEDILGIAHKDYTRSHYISLDEYFTKEKQEEEKGWKRKEKEEGILQ